MCGRDARRSVKAPAEHRRAPLNIGEASGGALLPECVARATLPAGPISNNVKAGGKGPLLARFGSTMCKLDE